jgi:hypothetical protein
MRIEQGHGLADDAVLLELADAPPARGLGEAHPIGDFRGAQLPVSLEQFQNFGVELVHETPIRFSPVARNIVAQAGRFCHLFATA